MRNIVSVISLIIAISSTCYSQLTPENTDFGLAVVGRQIQGIFVFYFVEPYYEYDYVATIEYDFKGKDIEKNFTELVSKARKRHNYFNGIIIRTTDQSKADLIRFQGLKVSSGGIEIGSYVSFINSRRVNYGKVVSLDSKKEKASIDYVDIFDDKKIKKVKLSSLNPLSKEEFDADMLNFKKQVELYKFVIDECVSWESNSLFSFGKIASLDSDKHKAEIHSFNDFGKSDIISVDYLDLKKISEENYLNKKEKVELTSKSYTFTIGEKVKWTRNNDVNIESFEISDIDYENFRLQLITGIKDEKIQYKWTSFSNINKL